MYAHIYLNIFMYICLHTWVCMGVFGQACLVYLCLLYSHNSDDDIDDDGDDDNISQPNYILWIHYLAKSV